MPKSIEIVFQNQHFVAVNKPPLCLSVRSRLGKKDPRPVLWDLLETQLKSGVRAIHRLDFEVGGLMLWAKSSQAQAAATKAFEQGDITKTYIAESENLGDQHPIPQWEEWRSRLLRGKKRAYESAHGKSAITHAKTLFVCDSHIRWHLRPITGRAHQLRYELSKRKCPVKGDALYGSTVTFENGIALQSMAIHNVNPTLKSLGLPDYLELNKSSQLFDADI